MRNWPRYSRGSLEAEEITRPLRKKIFFSTCEFDTTSVPLFWLRLTHWNRSAAFIVSLPVRGMQGAGFYQREVTGTEARSQATGNRSQENIPAFSCHLLPVTCHL